MRRAVYFIIFLSAATWCVLSCTSNRNDHVRNGTFREYHENGKLATEMTYKDGKIHGFVRNWHPNGQLHDSAYFEYGKPLGYSVSFYENGRKNYENYWSPDHKRDGTCRSWYRDGTLGSEEHLVNGRLHGKWKKWYPNGKIEFIQNYRDGVRDGKSIYFKDNGDTLRHEVYEKGRLVKSS